MNDERDGEADSGTFETRAIHAGWEPDAETGAIMPPIYASSTFAQDAPGEHRGYEYSRTGNPTRTALEDNLANLEGGSHGRAFASGMAAINTVLNLLSAGDHVVVGQDVYGGTHRLFTQVYEDYDLRFSFVDATDPDELQTAMTPRTALVWIETPTNPLMRVLDIESVARVAHDHDALLSVDNTFATPYLQRPIEYGADIVAHSLTKYLGGHSDVVGGALVTDDPDLDERLGFYQNSVGATPDPFACFLVLRGIKTLPVRMDRHSATARELASWLADHPAVETVHYPGLSSHPHHDVATRQMDDYGGMVSFELDASLEAVETFVSKTDVFTLAESLGGVESLLEHPASMTHAAVPADERRENGITDGLVRLSVGLEGVEDLRNDLAQALSVAIDR
ncbi:Cystathionine alpha synthase protein [Halorhabdus tiamatea SARL4B]|uniref:Cystathionine alpha synthase protein n=1 Tax=Halorhabdus tiamatea SARL4B TaxID=1033806 RepID=F7PIW0_9EURY|nr:cystathionine gamma-synthase [Halorhabdus tiamatea]ERJ05939.1 Cystathionine alpha synthase protein [Halorhabdus tiamatea SARL4B]CCQ32926.1 cystathionine gamma-lyase [Halorhabdus tiamatea SARL4B]